MLNVFRPDFEVVKEGRILYFPSGYKRFQIVTMPYDEKSSLIDKEFEISNLDLIGDMATIVKLEKLLSILK